MTEEMDLSGNGEDSLIDDDVILLSDEFSLKKDKIPLLEEHKKRIEELFDIEIEYGLTAQEDEMQWVTVSGEDDNRAKARDYVRALCNPEDTMSVLYPPALHPLLTRFHVHEKLEKQSHAVIIFSDIGTAEIQGNDKLSVTLALSAIEDVITKYESEQSNYTEGARSPAARQASLRLETELRRLSSENRTFEYDEDYSRWPDAVKRTILGWYIEESNPEIEPLENMSDLQEAAAEIESSSVTPKRPPAFCNDDELELGPAFAKYWDLGREKGYSDKDIESVLHNFGSQLKDHEFIQALKVHKTTSDSGADSTENPSQNPNGNGTPKQKKNSKKNSAARRKRNRSKETKKNKGGEGAYLELLTRDFEEEDHEMDIDGFKERSAQRIHLLQQALDLDDPVITDVRVNHKRDEDDGIAVDSTDWKVIPERNRGRRKMPYSKQQQNPQQNSQPSPSQNSDPRSAQEGFTNQQQQPNIGAYQPNYFSPNRQDFSPRGAQSRSYSPRGQQSPQGNRGGRGKSPSRLSPSRQPPRSYIHDRQSPSRRRSPARFNHVNPQAPQHSGDTVAANASGKPLRYIIIDGSNVAMSHSNGRCFSCRGIEICVNYFLKRGHKEITVFVPQWRTQIPKPGYAIEDQHILHELKEKGHLVFTPARRVPGKNIVCYDDRFVIRLAIETEGIIISNDNYRDLWWENVDYRNIIEKSLLPYSFVGDFFMPPDDPLGRDGPHIDQFLTKTDEDDARVPHFQRGNASNAGLRQQGRQQNLRARGSQNFPQMSTSPRGRGNMILPPLQTGFGRGMPPGQNLFPPPQDYVNTGPPPQPHFQNQAFQNQGSQNKGFKQSQGHPKQGNQAFKNQGSSPPKQHPSRAWLRAQLLNVFPDNERQVDLVLQRNLKEINLNKLSSYILEMLQE